MSLISPKLQLYWKKTTLLGQATCFHPYKWNKSENRPEPCKSRLRFYIWCVNVAIAAVYFLFVVTRCVQVNIDESGKYSPVKKMYMKCIVFHYALPVLYQVVLVLKRRDILLYFQQNEKLMNQLGELLLRERQRNRNRSGPLVPKIFDLFFDLAWYSFILFSPFMGLIATVNPNSPEFLSSVILPERGIYRWLLLVPCVIFQAYYIQMNVVYSCFYMYFGFAFIFPGVIVLREIKSWMQAETISQERVKLILEVYKKVEIMRKSFHFVFCTFFVPGLKGTLMGVTIFCCYGVVRMHGLIVVFLACLGIVCFTVLVVIMISFAKYYNMSSEILFLMKSPKFYNSLNACQRKDQLSLTPIRMQMGSAYYIDTPCVVTVLQIVMDTTVNLLLTNR